MRHAAEALGGVGDGVGEPMNCPNVAASGGADRVNALRPVALAAGGRVGAAGDR
jgi:hypothetical protein